MHSLPSDHISALIITASYFQQISSMAKRSEPLDCHIIAPYASSNLLFAFSWPAQLNQETSSKDTSSHDPSCNFRPFFRVNYLVNKVNYLGTILLSLNHLLSWIIHRAWIYEEKQYQPSPSATLVENHFSRPLINVLHPFLSPNTLASH